MFCGRVQTWPCLLSVILPFASGLKASTGPFLADGTTISPGTATGEATNRSVWLYLPLGFIPPQRHNLLAVFEIVGHDVIAAVRQQELLLARAIQHGRSVGMLAFGRGVAGPVSASRSVGPVTLSKATTRA